MYPLISSHFVNRLVFIVFSSSDFAKIPHYSFQFMVSSSLTTETLNKKFIFDSYISFHRPWTSQPASPLSSFIVEYIITHCESLISCDRETKRVIRIFPRTHDFLQYLPQVLIFKLESCQILSRVSNKIEVQRLETLSFLFSDFN